jgi:hypothetical protein
MPHGTQSHQCWQIISLEDQFHFRMDAKNTTNAKAIVRCTLQTKAIYIYPSILTFDKNVRVMRALELSSTMHVSPDDYRRHRTGRLEDLRNGMVGH